jgi:hypothetical protein
MKTITAALDEQFRRLHLTSTALIESIAPELLYKLPREPTSSVPIYSTGEHLLRSAGAVEQTFGGLTTNLWDDPFEWTLPESLVTPAYVSAYLMEVEGTRQRAFGLFKSDEDLYKKAAVPSGGTEELIRILLHTIARAWHHQGRAFAAYRMVTDERLPVV